MTEKLNADSIGKNYVQRKTNKVVKIVKFDHFYTDHNGDDYNSFGWCFTSKNRGVQMDIIREATFLEKLLGVKLKK